MRRRLRSAAAVLGLALAGVLLASLPSHAAEFSADMVIMSDEGTSTGKIYVLDDMIRQEAEIDGESTVTILRIDKGLAWMLLADDMYLEIPLPDDLSRPAGTEYDEVSLGVQTVNGQLCDVVRYVYRDRSLGTLTHWVARGLGYPVRMEAADSSGAITMTVEYRNVQVREICPCLFEVPEGYEKLSVPFGMPGGMPGTVMPGTSGATGMTCIPGTCGPTIGQGGMPDMSSLPDLAAMFGGGEAGSMPAGTAAGTTPGVPIAPFNVERTLPMEYSGVLSVETHGHREWVKPFIGAIGEGEAQDIVCREEVLEKAIIRVPSLGVMAGVVLDPARLVEVTVSFEYRRYENGVLVESWDCPVRDVTAPAGFSPGGLLANPILGDVYTVAFGGFVHLGELGEHSLYSGDGSLISRSMESYSGHEVSITDIPIPQDTARLAGTRTARLPGDDSWITAQLSWDFEPVGRSD